MPSRGELTAIDHSGLEAPACGCLPPRRTRRKNSLGKGTQKIAMSSGDSYSSMGIDKQIPDV